MKRPIEVLTPQECQALLRNCGRGITCIRNQAIIVVLWRAGLRAAECLSLRPKDVDEVTGTVRVLNGKGGKSRTVALDAQAMAVVMRWQDFRGEFCPPRGAPLFCSSRGKRLDSSYLRQRLPQIARRAGITKRVHAHGLRHTYAIELAREGIPVHLIQMALGHANVATTSRYIAHTGAPELVAAIRRRPAWQTPSGTLALASKPKGSR